MTERNLVNRSQRYPRPRPSPVGPEPFLTRARVYENARALCYRTDGVGTIRRRVREKTTAPADRVVIAPELDFRPLSPSRRRRRRRRRPLERASVPPRTLELTVRVHAAGLCVDDIF